MKKLNKYLFLLAAVVLGLTACEKSIEREPSPQVDKNVVAFKSSSVVADINPAKSKLQYGLTVYRSFDTEEVAIPINVLEGDSDIIKVPATVTFAVGVKEVDILLEFPEAELDSSYSVILEIDEQFQSPYFTGGAQCAFTVNIATWEDVTVPAVFVDGTICNVFSLDPMIWYVKYQEKLNTDGTKDYRFLNPYRNFDPEAEADQFGVYNVFAYNAEGDVDMTENYHWDMHVDADGNVTFPRTYIGVDYGYGPMSPWLMADFLAAKNGTEPDYTANPCGKYDDATKTITIPNGALLLFMGTSGYYAGEHVIYLDSKAYQDDHLTISDYNGSDIEWKVQESSINIFESSIFKFTNEEQKLFKAVNPIEENPKSPYLNLYCLKDAYAKGGNLAFYWNGEDGDIEIPVPQNTKLSFMGKELYIQEATGTVATKDVKGTAVIVFTFNISVASKAGDYVGDFTETFTMAEEAIVFEKSDFIGNFALAGYSPFDGKPAELAVEIKEEGEDLAVIGLYGADTIWAGFDAETGVLSIAPQELPDSFTYKGANYAQAFITMDAKGTKDYENPLLFAFKLDGAAHLTADCKVLGYLIYIPDLGGSADGLYDLTLTPTAATPAPRKAPAVLRKNVDVNKHAVRTNKPSVDGLSFQGRRLKAAKAL